MKILLTGGSGFIGAWIVKAFRDQGIEVRVFDVIDDRQRLQALYDTNSSDLAVSQVNDIEWIIGDVGESDAVLQAAHGCDQIVHLAAILTPDCAADPLRGVHVNLNGSLNVLEAARVHGIRQVLYMSSASVYGPDNGSDPFPITLYGVWKLAMEGAARCYWLDHGVASAGFRPLVVYGPGREVGLSAGPTLACRAAARAEAYTIPFTGDTDLVYVSDVVSAFQAAVQSELTGASTYTIVGEQASTDRLIDCIQTCVPDAQISASGPSVPVAARIDAGRVRSDFAGVTRTPLMDGVTRTIDWYRHQVLER